MSFLANNLRIEEQLHILSSTLAFNVYEWKLNINKGSYTRVQNALITMHSRCRDIESARSVFSLTANCDLCSWNCMISAFSQNKAEIRAVELFRSLEPLPDDITLVSVLSACTQLGVLRHGRQIHGRVFRLRFQENSFISAALLCMYNNTERLDIACKMFQNSREKSHSPWNSMISYHGKGRKASELFLETCNSGMKPTKSSFISLLSACSHSGFLNEGLLYYSHMLKECEGEPATEHHKLHEAYEFIKHMPNQPKPGVWGAMLSACSYRGDIKMGKKFAQLLFELEPENIGYYTTLSSMNVASGRQQVTVSSMLDKGLVMSAHQIDAK